VKALFRDPYIQLWLRGKQDVGVANEPPTSLTGDLPRQVWSHSQYLSGCCQFPPHWNEAEPTGY